MARKKGMKPLADADIPTFIALGRQIAEEGNATPQQRAKRRPMPPRQRCLPRTRQARRQGDGEVTWRARHRRNDTVVPANAGTHGPWRCIRRHAKSEATKLQSPLALDCFASCCSPRLRSQARAVRGDDADCARLAQSKEMTSRLPPADPDPLHPGARAGDVGADDPGGGARGGSSMARPAAR